jgi:hypothetical protein
MQNYQIMERKYVDFDQELRKVRKMIKSEIAEILKENIKDDGEVRIDLADEDEREYGIIKMAFPDDNSFEHIASIVCKVEGANVDITLYTDEDVDFELYEIDDYDALAQVYDVIYDYFDNIY